VFIVVVYFVMTQSGNFWIHPRLVAERHTENLLHLRVSPICYTRIKWKRRCVCLSALTFHLWNYLMDFSLNFTRCFVSLWNYVSHIMGTTKIGGGCYDRVLRRICRP